MWVRVCVFWWVVDFTRCHCDEKWWCVSCLCELMAQMSGMLVCVFCVCAHCQPKCPPCWCVGFVFVRIEGPNICHVGVCVLHVGALGAQMSAMLVCVFCVCAHWGPT